MGPWGNIKRVRGLERTRSHHDGRLLEDAVYKGRYLIMREEGEGEHQAILANDDRRRVVRISA